MFWRQRLSVANRLSVMVLAAYENVVMADGKPLFRQKNSKWQDNMLDAVAKMQKHICQIAFQTRLEWRCTSTLVTTPLD